MRLEKSQSSVEQKIPDVMYFRGYRKGGGEYAFALTEERYGGLGSGYPGLKPVAWRYIDRVLRHPANRHLLGSRNILADLSETDFSEKLSAVSAEAGLPQHVRELLVEAARRLDDGPSPDAAASRY